jgi:hypothetical protein
VSEISKGLGRIAFRVEGTLWCAYWARPETMDGASLIGSIRLAGVADPERKRLFMDLMQEIIADAVAETMGAEVTWPEPVSAPESERGGRA